MIELFSPQILHNSLSLSPSLIKALMTGINTSDVFKIDLENTLDKMSSLTNRIVSAYVQCYICINIWQKLHKCKFLHYENSHISVIAKLQYLHRILQETFNLKVSSFRVFQNER